MVKMIKNGSISTAMVSCSQNPKSNKERFAEKAHIRAEKRREEEKIKTNKWFERIGNAFIGKNDKENSVSLYDYMSSIVEVYKAFKEEYDDLEKLDIGNHIEFVNYKEEYNYRALVLRIYNFRETSLISNGEYHLHIIEHALGKNLQPLVCAYLTDEDNNEVVHSKVNEAKYNVLGGYIDLFSKYAPLFRIYMLQLYDYDNEVIKNKGIHGKITLNAPYGILNRLSGVTLKLGDFCRFNTLDVSYHINDNDMSIDKTYSILVNGNGVRINNIDEVLKSIQIDRDLISLYDVLNVLSKEHNKTNELILPN